MKLYTPEKTDLIDISRIEPHPDGLLIEGTIMGAMPMKAILRPAELRRGLRFARLRVLLTVAAMLFRKNKT